VVSDAQFLLRLPRKMRDDAAEAARAEGVTGSEWIRRAITERLDRQEVARQLAKQGEEDRGSTSFQETESPHVPVQAKRSKDMWWL
jgi:hypothetical protein